MPGTTVGALKIAARRVGMGPQAYAAQLLAGLRWCWGCRAWHDQAAFGSDRTRADGLTVICRQSKNEKDRARWAAGIRRRPG